MSGEFQDSVFSLSAQMTERKDDIAEQTTKIRGIRVRARDSGVVKSEEIMEACYSLSRLVQALQGALQWDQEYGNNVLHNLDETKDSTTETAERIATTLEGSSNGSASDAIDYANSTAAHLEVASRTLGDSQSSRILALKGLKGILSKAAELKAVAEGVHQTIIDVRQDIAHANDASLVAGLQAEHTIVALNEYGGQV